MHDQFWANSVWNISGLEIKGFPMVPKNIVFFSDGKGYGDDQHSDRGLLTRQIPGDDMDVGPLLWPHASAPGLDKVCWCGYRFPYILPAPVRD